MKKKLLVFLLALTMIIPSVGMNNAEAAVTTPYVTAVGSELVLHTNGYTVTGLKYMYTATPYTYMGWTHWDRTGKSDPVHNGTKGYVTLKTYTNGARFAVDYVGYYNFIITFSGGAVAEVPYSVYVDTVNEQPSATAVGADVTINPGDFEITKVKVVYSRDDYDYVGYSELIEHGKLDKVKNSNEGYKKLTPDAGGAYTYKMYATGYYFFVMSYGNSKIAVSKLQYTPVKQEPYFTVSGAAIVLHDGDFTITGCKYVYTPGAYTYRTWQNCVDTGKLYPLANTDAGYRSVKGTYSERVVPVNRNGYYTVIFSYAEGETVQTGPLNYTGRPGGAGDGEPELDDDEGDASVVIYPEAKELQSVRYAYIGTSDKTVSNESQFTTAGLLHTDVNGPTGYITVEEDINDINGTRVDLSTEGWYVFCMTYEDSSVYKHIQVTHEELASGKPYAVVDDDDDMLIHILANGYELTQILYMYSEDSYIYSTWSNYKAKGRENTYVNGDDGYRTIEAADDTDFICYDIGYYTFIIKYIDEQGNRRERTQTIHTNDSRVTVYLHAMGGSVEDENWHPDDITEDGDPNPGGNKCAYSTKAVGGLILPTNVTVPKSSETVQFGGWYTDMTFGTRVTSLDLVKGDAPVHLYAKFTYTASSYTSEKIRYSYQGKNLDAYGIVNGVQVQTTYSNGGYKHFINYTGSEYTTPVNENYDYGCSSGAFGNPYLPTGAGSNIWYKAELPDDKILYVAAVCNVIDSYVEYNYILYNDADTDLNYVTFGAAADVQIKSVDSASIRHNSDGNGPYYMMEGDGYAFRLYTNDADYWAGGYSSGRNFNGRGYQLNVFNSAAGNASFLDRSFSSGDSAIAYHWRNMTIPAKGYVLKTVRLGVGTAASMGGTAKSTVMLIGNGGTFPDDSTEKILTTTTSVTLAGENVPEREGYDFVEYNTSKYGNGTSYSAGASFSGGTLYAIWSRVTLYPLYKLYNNSVVQVWDSDEGKLKKMGSGKVAININYQGGLLQQGTYHSKAVSADDDLIATVNLSNHTADTFYLPTNITVKVGSKWLTSGEDFVYIVSADHQSANLKVNKECLVGTTHIYIYGTDELPIEPIVTIEDKNIYVKQSTTLDAVITNEQPGYTYAYKWFLVQDSLGRGRKELNAKGNPSVKTDSLAFGGVGVGDYYYVCRVTATRAYDGAQLIVYTDAACVHVRKRTNSASVLVSAEGDLSVSSNPENAGVTYTFYTDAECTNKTGYENGASKIGGRPLKPQAGDAPYYVKAVINESKNYYGCETDAEVYDNLPQLPYIEKTGNIANVRNNDAGVTNVKFMYTTRNFQYTTWKKYTAEGKLFKSVNTKTGYRNLKGVATGPASSLDGAKIVMDHAGYYVFLITFDDGKEVSYTINVSEWDTMYQKPIAYQPSTNGHLVLFNNNDSGLSYIRYMYSSSPYTYSTWSSYTKQGKKNTAVNTSAGYRYVEGSASWDSANGVWTSTLDGYGLTLGNDGYYTFLMKYGSGKECATTLYVGSNYETDANQAVLLIENGVITASMLNGGVVQQIKFHEDADYTRGDTLKVSTPGIYNIDAIDNNGYLYHLVADVKTLDSGATLVVDKTALYAKLQSTISLLAEPRIAVTSKSQGTAPGKYVLRSYKDALTSKKTSGQSVYNDPAATQAQVNQAYKELCTAYNEFLANCWQVNPDLVYGIGDHSIRAYVSAASYSFRRIRFIVDNKYTANITPAVEANWTGFNGHEHMTLYPVAITNQKEFEWINCEDGIYTFIVQQNEGASYTEYVDYAIVSDDPGADDWTVAKDTLDEQITLATQLLSDYTREADTVSGTCIKTEYYDLLTEAVSTASTYSAGILANKSTISPEGDVIPEIIALKRAYNQALSNIINKGAAAPTTPVYVCDVTVNPVTHAVTFEGPSVQKVAVVYYKKAKTWNQIKNGECATGFQNATNAGSTMQYVYTSAPYNGDYSALVKFSDGHEEFRYFEISGIEYPFTVMQLGDQIYVASRNPSVIPEVVGYAYGRKANASKLQFLEDTTVSDYASYFDALGNGWHTVKVKIGGKVYYDEIEISGINAPVIITWQGKYGVYTNGLAYPVSTVMIASGVKTSFSDFTNAINVNELRNDLSSGTYSIYYRYNGADSFETFVIP